MPADAAVAKSDAKSQTWWSYIKTAFSQFFEDKCPRMSAALAYYTAFALAPMLVIAVFVVRMFIRSSEEAQSKVVGAMSQVIGGLTPEQANQIIQAAERQGSGIFATIISLILAIIGATGVFGELQDSLNTIWDVKPKPRQGVWGFIRTRILSLAMVLSIAFILLTSLAVSTFITGMSARLTGGSQVIGHVLDFVFSVGVTFVLFGLIFKVLPDVKLTWRDVWRGALVTAVLFTIGKILLGIYLSKGSAASAFGAAASLAALLIWVNYSGWILFYGAELTKAQILAEKRKVQPSEHAMPISQDERVKQGIPSSTSAVAGGNEPRQPSIPPRARPRPQAAPVLARNGDGRSNLAREMLIGVGAAGLGAVATYFGKKNLTPRPKIDNELADQIRLLDTELRRIMRTKRHPEDLRLESRLDELRQRVREVTAASQAKASGRPTWAVRVGDMISGRS